MDRKQKLYNDILIAISLIEEFSVNIITFNEYIADSKTKSAVERQLSIIGEAITHLKKLGVVDLANTKKIIDLRNILVHAYSSIDDTIIWAILNNHIKPLKEEVADKLINE